MQHLEKLSKFQKMSITEKDQLSRIHGGQSSDTNKYAYESTTVDDPCCCTDHKHSTTDENGQTTTCTDYDCSW